MEKSTQQAQQIEEALFAYKNKQYGAYVLRQKRTRNLMRGLVGSLLGLTLLYLSPLMWVLINDAMRYDLDETTTEVAITPYSELMAPLPIEQQKEKPVEPVLAEPQVSTVRYVKPVVKADEETLDEEVPTVEELAKANPGRITQEGSQDIYSDYIQPKVAPPEPPKPAEPPKPKPKEVVFDFVSQKPEFPGGEEALMAYLTDNLKYPRVALENNIQGTVAIRFVVDTQGRISSAEILKDIGGGCGAEALRVVKSMPHWTPGEQNGVKVHVRYVLPVRFRLRT